jgi:hypothetical protein
VKPIGKGPCSQVGVDIAKSLGLANPEKFTGQTWRGTSTTLGADAGLNDSELQNITGHRSAASLRVYKANSEVQKQKVAAALSLRGKENNVSNKKRSRDDVVVASSRNGSIILNNHSSIASLTIKQFYAHENDDEDDDDDEDEQDDDEDEDNDEE